MKELKKYKGYLIVTDWFGEEGIRIFSPKNYEEKTGMYNRTTVGFASTIPEAEKTIDELLGS